MKEAIKENLVNENLAQNYAILRKTFNLENEGKMMDTQYNMEPVKRHL